MQFPRCSGIIQAKKVQLSREVPLWAQQSPFQKCWLNAKWKQFCSTWIFRAFLKMSALQVVHYVEHDAKNVAVMPGPGHLELTLCKIHSIFWSQSFNIFGTKMDKSWECLSWKSGSFYIQAREYSKNLTRCAEKIPQNCAIHDAGHKTQAMCSREICAILRELNPCRKPPCEKSFRSILPLCCALPPLLLSDSFLNYLPEEMV